MTEAYRIIEENAIFRILILLDEDRIEWSDLNSATGDIIAEILPGCIYKKRYIDFEEKAIKIIKRKYEILQKVMLEKVTYLRLKEKS